MRLAVINITPVDCYTLVDLLHRVARADDLDLAARIERGIENDTKILALSSAERTTLLGVLDDPPDGLVDSAASSRAHRGRARRCVRGVRC